MKKNMSGNNKNNLRSRKNNFIEQRASYNTFKKIKVAKKSTKMLRSFLPALKVTSEKPIAN